MWLSPGSQLTRLAPIAEVGDISGDARPEKPSLDSTKRLFSP